jgi:hypothetical protein
MHERRAAKYKSGVVTVAIALGAVTACGDATSASRRATGNVDAGKEEDGATVVIPPQPVRRATVGTCPPLGSSCTRAEYDEYIACVTTACDSAYTECLGAEYKKKTFAGICGGYMECVYPCSCDDLDCVRGCGEAPVCTPCLDKAETCAKVSKCSVPKCMVR